MRTTMVDVLDKGRECFRKQSWTEAFTHLSAADGQTPLEPDDLERFATAAYLIGKDAESQEALARAHQISLQAGRVAQAARCAFWLGMALLMKGERARGGGWISRARSVLDDGEHDCVEQGYVLVPDALRALSEGDASRALDVFGRAAEIGDRYRDPDLMALGRLGRGQALVRLGEIADGIALLDEAMVAVEAGEVSPIVAGIVYCAVIEVCQEIYDLRRAQEWTTALTRWCDSHPDLVPYRGQCLVRRTEILQLHGEWPDAMVEAERACERLAGPPGEPAAGAAFYQLGELLRLRGEHARAEDAYREAGRWGRNPQPGLALLRLAEGQTDVAAAAIARETEASRDRAKRSRLLPAYVEIMLTSGDVQAARSAADELAAIAADLDAPFLRAVAEHAQGAVLLAEGDARAAHASLARAWTAWHEIEAPYEVARVRVLMGLACRDFGDPASAEIEFDAARATFQELGAAPDLARLEALLRRTRSDGDHLLTPREMEVLRLLAAGETNKAIASGLFISERTVERHVSNIFNKMGVSSRAAATAYAYEHGLV